MSRKEIQTIIFLCLVAAIIWALTACEKKGNVNDDYSNFCKQEIEKQGDPFRFWYGEYAYEYELRYIYEGRDVFDIEVANCQRVNMSLEELEKIHYDYVARVFPDKRLTDEYPDSVFSADQPDEIIETIRNRYRAAGKYYGMYFEHIKADVAFTALVTGGKNDHRPQEYRRFKWTCYFKIAIYTNNFERYCVPIYCLPQGSTFIEKIIH